MEKWRWDMEQWREWLWWDKFMMREMAREETCPCLIWLPRTSRRCSLRNGCAGTGAIPFSVSIPWGKFTMGKFTLIIFVVVGSSLFVDIPFICSIHILYIRLSICYIHLPYIYIYMYISPLCHMIYPFLYTLYTHPCESGELTDQAKDRWEAVWAQNLISIYYYLMVIGYNSHW